MDEEQVDRIENLLSYAERHVLVTNPPALAVEWWTRSAADVLRSLLPEWSAYREAVAQ